ncbi:MAG: hypothetical protein FD165_1068 [Gammaproteobacteria bacterium]|nr:MAG: hypothetical protein FD165_1068 [Gammaproteobacteria bacterium]TND06224.1 MAG: hypothetical protein FD120_711 [Gammaproteobacteria bacterium]
MTGQVIEHPPQDVPVALVSLLCVVALVAAIALLMQRPGMLRAASAHAPPTATVDAKLDPAGHASQLAQHEIDTRFLQAVAMLHAKQYDNAITALHRVLLLAPRMPEAHVNMGFALIGAQRYDAARDFFQTAIDLRPYQANAYWGLAVALEQLADLEGALGAMRAYIHLAKPDDPYVRKARSALWEWESTLKRGPLPVEEQEFLDRGARQWSERNSADVDRRIDAPQVIDLLPQQ